METLDPDPRGKGGGGKTHARKGSAGSRGTELGPTERREELGDDGA